MGASSPAWSTSCMAPIPVCGRGTLPEMTSNGTPAAQALAMPVAAFVTPGPAVTMATPTVPVTSPAACAMKTAAPSWRTSTMSIPDRATASHIGWM